MRLARDPPPDPQAELAATLVERARTDRSIRRVTELVAALAADLLRDCTATVGVPPTAYAAQGGGVG